MAGYIFTHENRQFDPDGAVRVPDPDAHNCQLEAEELTAWATCPDGAIGYVSDTSLDTRAGRHQSQHARVVITTWLGTPIGTGHVTNVYRNNLGARIVCLRVRGINGASYYGRYGYDSGSAVRLRLCKVQS